MLSLAGWLRKYFSKGREVTTGLFVGWYLRKVQIPFG
jgi:hypothetical protein